MKRLKALAAEDSFPAEAVLGAASSAEEGPYDGFVLLVLSSHAGCSLELRTVRGLRQRLPVERELSVVGGAENAEGARKILAALLEKAVKEKGSPDLRAYFSSLPPEAWVEGVSVS